MIDWLITVWVSVKVVFRLVLGSGLGQTFARLKPVECTDVDIEKAEAIAEGTLVKGNYYAL